MNITDAHQVDINSAPSQIILLAIIKDWRF